MAAQEGLEDKFAQSKYISIGDIMKYTQNNKTHSKNDDPN